MSDGEGVTIAAADLSALVARLFVAAGVPQSVATTVADGLVGPISKDCPRTG
jgi:hypothetical protein